MILSKKIEEEGYDLYSPSRKKFITVSSLIFGKRKLEYNSYTTLVDFNTIRREFKEIKKLFPKSDFKIVKAKIYQVIEIENI